MKKILLFVVLLVLSVSQAKITFNEKQLDNMRYACNVGKEIINNGTDSCYLMAALVWAESSAGMNVKGGKGHKSFGLFQNNITTVKNRMKQQGIRPSEHHIKHRLITERSFSAKFAKIELQYWLKQRKGNLIQALASYNAGWKWQRGEKYARDVINKRNYLIRNNSKLKIRR